MNLSYLCVGDKAQDVIHDANYIMQEKKGCINRRVYESVDYLPFEQQQIVALKQELLKHPKIKIPDDWKQCDYLKMLNYSKHSIKDAVKNMQEHVKWRLEMDNITLTDEMLGVLKSGAIYVYGTDMQYRPIIIIQAQLIIQFPIALVISTINYLLLLIVRQVLVPYYIENWVIIMDVSGVDNYNDLTPEFIQNMGLNYCGRLNMMYILNPKADLMDYWSKLSEHVNKYEQIVFIQQPSLMDIEDSQLELKYGGKLPNLKTYWPPQIIDEIIMFKQVMSMANEDESIFKGMTMKQSLKKGTSNQSSLFIIVVHNEDKEMIHSQALLLKPEQIDCDDDNVEQEEPPIEVIHWKEPIKQSTKTQHMTEFELKLEGEPEQPMQQSCCDNHKCLIF